MNQIELRDKIVFYLKNVKRDTLMGAVIHAGIRNNLNFNNLMQLIKDEYENDPSGIKKCIGEVPLRLILSYGSGVDDLKGVRFGQQ